MYVDDIIVTSSSRKYIKALISKLNDQFALKLLGNLEYFLGIEISHHLNGPLFSSQAKYIRDLIAKANMVKAKRMHTPMISSLKLSRHGSDYLHDPTFIGQ